MINRRAIALHLALEGLGAPLNLSAFEHRLALQKTVHLLQVSGVHLGYSYSWYKHGPYSPELTEEAFDLAEELKRDPAHKFSEGWELAKDSIQRTQKLKTSLESLQLDFIEKSYTYPSILELVSSTLWAVQRKWAPSNRPKDVYEKLKENGKEKFELEGVKIALTWLRKNDLINAN